MKPQRREERRETADSISASFAPLRFHCPRGFAQAARRNASAQYAVQAELRKNSANLLIIGEAKPEPRARTYGAYSLLRDCVVTSGSFLGAGGTLWFWWFGARSAKRTGRPEGRPG